MVSRHYLLYLNPKQVGTREPVIDRATRRMTAAFRQAKKKRIGYCGVHRCICDARSECYDYNLPNGMQTNSLCVHYLAHHRKEIPRSVLRFVQALEFGEADPTQVERCGPAVHYSRLLYLEPTNSGAMLPVIDGTTRRMAAAFRQAERTQSSLTRVRTCPCGASSDAYDYGLPNEIETSSLCVHYLAFHRSDVPPRQLSVVERFEFGEVSPTDKELCASSRSARFCRNTGNWARDLFH